MIDPDFGNWLAGFIDGEGSFYIVQSDVLRCAFSLGLRSDDRPILEECVARTGLGTIQEYTSPQGACTSAWRIHSKANCFGLCSLLTHFQLRARKREDFAIWEKAVVLQDTRRRLAVSHNVEIEQEMWRLRTQLISGRTVETAI